MRRTTEKKFSSLHNKIFSLLGPLSYAGAQPKTSQIRIFSSNYLIPCHVKSAAFSFKTCHEFFHQSFLVHLKLPSLFSFSHGKQLSLNKVMGSSLISKILNKRQILSLCPGDFFRILGRLYFLYVTVAYYKGHGYWWGKNFKRRSGPGWGKSFAFDPAIFKVFQRWVLCAKSGCWCQDIVFLLSFGLCWEMDFVLLLDSSGDTWKLETRAVEPGNSFLAALFFLWRGKCELSFVGPTSKAKQLFCETIAWLVVFVQKNDWLRTSNPTKWMKLTILGC